ncbi:MAG: hypothetical protein ACFCU3_10575, partial [Verrucomicrobiales bacterium]
LEGLPSVVFERERPRFNEAALVKGVNPEYAALDEEEAFERGALDRILQRALDHFTTRDLWQTSGR